MRAVRPRMDPPKRYRAQFWAGPRGTVDVWFSISRGAKPDLLAAQIVKRGTALLDLVWPLCGDRIYLVGIEDTETGRRIGEARP